MSEKDSKEQLWDWGFYRRSGRISYFGPYATEKEAQEAFQRVYGYWPDGFVCKVEYHYQRKDD